MKKIVMMCAGLWVALAVSMQAEELAITGFSGGELSFRDVHAVGSYTIEWSSSLDETNWSCNWSQLSQVPATGGEVRVRVPMYFRVRHNPVMPSPLPESAPPVSLADQAPVSPKSETLIQSSVAPGAVTAPERAPLNDSGFGGGAGTPADPFRITSADQLQRIESSLSSHYVLLSDIDISCTAGWDDGKGLRPIGSHASPFSGVFNGNGHRITGLRIARFGIVTSDIALFGATSSNAVIANVSIQDAVVAGCDYVGILAGRNYGTITNCHVAGIVSGSGTFGGLIGCNLKGGVITRCSATVGVRPLWVGNHLGGLAGGNQGVMQDCFATGVVTGQEDPGGLVGVNHGGLIERCYAYVDVESSFGGFHEDYHRGAGGLVALHQGGGIIRDCFAAGTVKGPANLPKGALVGVMDTKAMVYNCFAVSSGTDSNESIGRIFGIESIADCKPWTGIVAPLFFSEEAPLKSWDFRSTWSLESTGSAGAYPGFR